MAAGYRVATLDDLDAVTAVMATAFQADPVWGPYSFPDDRLRVEQLGRFWRPQLRSAMRFPWTLVTASCEAAAVWIPPGEPEMTPAEERDLVALAERMLGAAQTRVVFDVFRRLEDAHPEEPHYYLSLLGTHEDHRGCGRGMALLAASLEAIDRERLPAYLESTNPANDARYGRVGFRPVGVVELENGHRITTMWRDAA
jgi:GNAT superfamily N-acetyltransferase